MFKSARILPSSLVPRLHWGNDCTGPQQHRGEVALDSQHFLSERTAPRVTRYSFRMQDRSLSLRNLAQLAPALPALRSWSNPAGTRALPLAPGPLQNNGRGTLARPQPGGPGPGWTRPPPLPLPSCRSLTPTARLSLAKKAGRRPPALPRPARPSTPPGRDARPRRAHWTAAGGRGLGDPGAVPALHPYLASRDRSLPR